MPDAASRAPRDDDPGAAVARVADGDLRALARAISVVEGGGPAAAGLVAAALPLARRVPIVGVTGAGGAGKSTLVDALIATCRSRDERVAVLAIDPTSPFSGGALLGDRVRMQRHSEDDGVFIRSMATRGVMGGLAAAVYDTLLLLTVAGFDRIVVETVGVGQDEVDVVGVVDTTCVVLTPGSGDAVQTIKAGIIEVADIFVVNKADMAGADGIETQLRTWVTAFERGPRKTPIVRTVAVRGEGIDELWEAIAAHEAWYRAAGAGDEKRRAVVRLRLRTLLRERLLAAARARGYDGAREDELIDAIVRGDTDAHTVAGRVIREVLGK